MIKDTHKPNVKIVTALGLPTVTDELLQKHLERGSVLYLTVDEDMFMTENSAEELYETLSWMLSLEAAQCQSMLVVRLMSSASPRPYDQLRYWQRSGGCAIALEPSEVDPFFRDEDRWIGEHYA